MLHIPIITHFILFYGSNPALKRLKYADMEQVNWIYYNNLSSLGRQRLNLKGSYRQRRRRLSSL
jgi:hypothetical protein